MTATANRLADCRTGFDRSGFSVCSTEAAGRDIIAPAVPKQTLVTQSRLPDFSLRSILIPDD
ncbi:MAG: hypothetical protein ACKVHE_35515 [Planctomycetales bacterium]|jgi:hypothetical protein